jgi:hypothetical protein
VNAAKKTPAPAKAKQTELALTYSVGDWVWGKAGGPNNPRRLLARIESAQPIKTELGEAWLVRCYYSAERRIARPGWSTTVEHRRVDRALNAAEVAKLRNDSVIPHAGSEVLP